MTYFHTPVLYILGSDRNKERLQLLTWDDVEAEMCHFDDCLYDRPTITKKSGWINDYEYCEIYRAE